MNTPIRLEAKLEGKKNIPADKLEDLLKVIQTEDFNPFKRCFLVDFRYIKIPIKVENIQRLLKQQSFKTLTQHNGFHYARKVFNKHRDIQKSVFGKLLNIKSEFSLGELYHELIYEYLNDDSKTLCPESSEKFHSQSEDN